MPEELPDNIENTLAREAGIPKQKKGKKEVAENPTYRMMPDSKIPVSSVRGKLWKSRRDCGMKAQDPYVKAFDESNAYYRNDHSGKQDAKKAASKRVSASGDIYSENIIYSNTRTLLPIVYARNPSIEITEQDRSPETTDVKAKRATVAERLINKLFTRASAPGINLKPKARRAILNTLLSNHAYAVIGYNEKQHSSEQALVDLKALGKELAEAKNTKTIEQVEGKLLALENKVDVLAPSGHTLKIKTLREIVIDPDRTSPDIYDANWIMYSDYLSTDYLNAEFGMDKDGKIVSVYEPTHVLDARGESGGDTTESIEQEVNNFVLFKLNSSGDAFGYDNDESYNKAKRTKVWYVWDKATRRCELYTDNDWKFPVWVWDDPYELEEFFPIYELAFNIDPESGFSKGEVSYYLDQQDAINEINSEVRRIRQFFKRNLLFNKNVVSQDDVNAVLKGDDGTMRGISIPEGQSIKDLIFAFPLPSADAIRFFDKQMEYQAIDRISSANEQLRGGQFKTNTTNKAVDFVRDANSVQVEDKTDMIEDWIGKIGFGMLQIAIKFMDDDMVAGLLGENDAKEWKTFVENAKGNVSRKYTLEIVGGSTLKPTSAAKKAEAANVGQILGQFAKASPSVVLVMLKLFERAFDEIVMTEEDWERIYKSIEAQTQQQMQAGQQQQPPAQSATPPEVTPQGQPGGADQLTQLLQSLPPQVQQAVMLAIQRGVPPQEAVQGVLSQMQGGAV